MILYHSSLPYHPEGARLRQASRRQVPTHGTAEGVHAKWRPRLQDVCCCQAVHQLVNTNFTTSQRDCTTESNVTLGNPSHTHKERNSESAVHSKLMAPEGRQLRSWQVFPTAGVPLVVGVFTLVNPFLRRTGKVSHTAS